jgi:hypothetical protein
MREDDWNPILSPLRGANDGSAESSESTPQKSVHNCSHSSELVRFPPAPFRGVGYESGACDKSNEKSDSSAARNMPMTSAGHVHFTDLSPR